MLNEAEQRRLAEIETRLRTDDPVFVQRFGDQGPHRAQARRRGPAALLAVVVAVAGVGIGLVVDSVGLVVVALTVIGIGAGIWITNRRL